MKSFSQVVPKQIIADFIIIFSNMDLTLNNWCFRRRCDCQFRSYFINEGHIPPATGSPSHQKRECAQVTTPPWGSPYPVTACCGHSNQREKSLKSWPLMTTEGPSHSKDAHGSAEAWWQTCSPATLGWF